MKMFIPKLDNSCSLSEYFCCTCCFEADKLRLVQECWESGCSKSCNHFGDFCIKDAIQQSRKTISYSLSFLIEMHGLNILYHKPGRCISCAGSGFANSVFDRTCIECAGTGVCPDCNGHYKRLETELENVDHALMW
jgi:hypothetical protein